MAGAGKQRYELRIPTPQGELDVTLKVPRGPMRLAELVPLVQEVTDLTAKTALEAEAAAGRPMSCSTGCAACCRQLVIMSPPEAFLLADTIAALPTAERQAAEARFAVAERALEAAGLFGSLKEILANSKAHDLQRIGAAYFELFLDCPNLLADQSCAVYPIRPLVCRDLYVTSPASWCDKPTLHVLQKVPTPPTAVSPLAKVTAKLTGDVLRLVPLPLALHFAATHKVLGRRRWPGPKLFTAFLETLG